MVVENLDYNKPIFAHSLRYNVIHVLLPHLERTSDYTDKGYDWFNITEFMWNSCRFYTTKEIAVGEYGGEISDICNGTLLFGDSNYDIQQFIINKGEENE